jgi:tRNA-splicing ligase RtcB
MAKLKLRGKDLRNIGYPEGPVISVAITVMEQYYKHYTPEAALALLREVLAAPQSFTGDGQLSKIAGKLIPEPSGEIAINPQALPYKVYGPEFIEEGALKQMDYAMRLPVTVAGALMPDAHQGATACPSAACWR